MHLTTPTPAAVQLAKQLTAARADTDLLFERILPDALYDRPIPERHRLIFYLGHLEAFDWNQIARAALGHSSFNPAFDKLFEFGIDPEPGMAASDQPCDWPWVDTVRKYNRTVRARLDEVLGEAPTQVVNFAIEHRLMHAETLAYLMHAMPYERKSAVNQTFPASSGVTPSAIKIPRGSVTLGQSPEHFGWDNEFARHRVTVQDFTVSKYKVTNGEYLEYVRNGAAAPHFWELDGGRYFYRGMFQRVPLPLDHPVYVTHNEACAYARWRGQELLTEPQFHRAAYGSPTTDTEPNFPWGNQEPDHTKGNFDFARWDPVAVNATPAGDSAFGISQLVGNGWEWTSTEFAPFAGFQPFPSYPGYSQNFFDGQHFVLKGGSPRTAAALLRRSFRNWFRPNYPHVYATFRLCTNG